MLDIIRYGVGCLLVVAVILEIINLSVKKENKTTIRILQILLMVVILFIAVLYVIFKGEMK